MKMYRGLLTILNRVNFKGQCRIGPFQESHQTDLFFFNEHFREGCFVTSVSFLEDIWHVMQIY